MTGLWAWLGKACYWLSYPALIIYLHNSRRVRIIVLSGNSILIVKNWLGDGSWDLVGGGINRGESALQAAVRELREETGLQKTEADLQFVTQQIYAKRGLRFSYDLFVLQLPDQAVVAGRKPEILAIGWTPLTKLSQLKLDAEVSAALAAWPETAKFATID